MGANARPPAPKPPSTPSTRAVRQQGAEQACWRGSVQVRAGTCAALTCWGSPKPSMGGSKRCLGGEGLGCTQREVLGGFWDLPPPSKPIPCCLLSPHGLQRVRRHLELSVETSGLQKQAPCHRHARRLSSAALEAALRRRRPSGCLQACCLPYCSQRSKPTLGSASHSSAASSHRPVPPSAGAPAPR